MTALRVIADCGALQAADPSAGLIAITVGLGSLAIAIYGAGVVALCQSVRTWESR